MAIVYMVSNNINNKKYIGQTIRSLTERWNSHISASRQGSKFRFHSAIRKYGVENFTLEIIFESDNVELIKNKEAELIIKHNTMTFGYNACPGGTGGWVVKTENYETWRTNNHKHTIGRLNGNAISTTNDEIVDIALLFIKENCYIPSHAKLIKYSKDKKIPKSFTKYRFNGRYKNLVKILENKTNIKYVPYYKCKKQKEQLSKIVTGKKWFFCKDIKSNRLCHEHELDIKLNWKKGRMTSWD